MSSVGKITKEVKRKMKESLLTALKEELPERMI